MGFRGKEEMGFWVLEKRLDFEAKYNKLEAKGVAFVDMGENKNVGVIRDCILEIVIVSI